MIKEPLDYILGLYEYTKEDLEGFASGICPRNEGTCRNCRLKDFCREKREHGIDYLQEWAKKELKKHFGVEKP